MVKAGAGGALVRVRDIGRVELGAETYSANLRFIGLEASGMGIQLLPSANALEVYQGVMAEMARLEKSFPPGLEWRLAFDNVGVVRESIKEVLVTLVEAIVLVILVMFLFLQNWRSTLIPAITIPVSLIGTFAFVKLFGFSINTLTLFGIVLATGIVVDDAIVVIENIERHMREEKKSSYRAAIDAMREVFGAVVVIGIVLVAVFVPVAFFPGTTGRLYQQFSLTIAFAVVLSVFNAVTFTPALSALLLAKESHAHGRFFTGVNRVIDGGTNGYVRLLKRALALRPLMLGLFALGLLGTWWLFRIVPSAFVPDEDEGYFITVIQAPAGASLEYTTEHRQAGGGHPVQGPRHPGRLLGGGVQLQRRGAQQRPHLHAAQGLRRAQGQEPFAGQAVLGRVRGPMMAHPRRAGDPVRAARASRACPSSAASSTSCSTRRAATSRAWPTPPAALVGRGQPERAGGGPLLGLPRQRPPARGRHRPRQGPQPEPAAARGHGRPPGVPGLGLRERLRLQQPGLPRVRPGRPAVPLGPQGPAPALRPRRRTAPWCRSTAWCARSETTAPQVISHFNLFRSAEINGAAAPGRELRARRSRPWSRSRGRACRRGSTSPGPASRSRRSRRARRPIYIFALSLILVYLVLAAQYESWVLPFIILLGVPLAVIGGLGAQLLRGPGQRRVLPGGARHADRPGGQELDPDRRVRRAAARARPVDRRTRRSRPRRIRLRPILMTSFAFILGVLPLAVATGAGAGARNSVGTSVAGGMLASTFLSIFFIPVLYVVIRTLAPGKVRRQRRRRGAGGRGRRRRPMSRRGCGRPCVASWPPSRAALPAAAPRPVEPVRWSR